MVLAAIVHLQSVRLLGYIIRSLLKRI